MSETCVCLSVCGRWGTRSGLRTVRVRDVCVCVCVWQVGYTIRFEDYVSETCVCVSVCGRWGTRSGLRTTCQRRVCVCLCVAGGVHDPV